MEKRVLITVLFLMMGSVLLGGGLASSNLSSGTFSGTIIKVDWPNQKFMVQNDRGEVTFQWNNETQINGLPIEQVGVGSNSLKEGMIVVVFFRKGDQNRVADQIDVKAANSGTLKGLSFPFECGVKVC